MDTWILILALVGKESSGVSGIEFNNQDACERAKPAVISVMQANGAPSWSGNHGVFVKAICVKKG